MKIKEIHQDNYTDNLNTFKKWNKVYEARNRPEISEVKKTIAIIAKVKPVSSGEIIT